MRIRESESDGVVTLRAKIMRRALDLASAGTTHLAVASSRAGGLVPYDLNILLQVRPGLSGLHTPVSLGVSAVSSGSFMNNVG